MASNNMQHAKYVYDLPYMVNKELCRILEQNDKWEELGGSYMGYRMLDIQHLRRQESPAEQLLILWGQKNHTIHELFVLLSKMQHHQALVVLKPFIDPKYHVLINEGEENISRLFGSHQRDPLASNVISVEENANCNLNIQGKRSSPEKHEKKILNVALPPKHEVEAAGASALPKQDNSKDRASANKENSISSTRRDSECSSIFTDGIGSSIPQISYTELIKATKNWDPRNILGRGGFGIVFQGTWKNTQVAIKRIEQKGGCDAAEASYQAQLEQSSKELKILNSIRHDNILPLYGFSVGGDHPCLIYQLMPNGSLEDRLLCRKSTPPLTWLQRHKIALGTACGLQFLHNLGDKPLIHGDIKSANILLDANLQPRIGDFGLAREGPIAKYTHIKLTKVQGTKPYLPGDFLRSRQMSTKVDTFSFGIVLFEIASGQRAYDTNRKTKLLVEIIMQTDPSQRQNILMDARLQNDPSSALVGKEIFDELLELGLKCTSRLPKDRPEMLNVLDELKKYEPKWSIVSRAQNVMLSPSPCPSNPLELQMFYDILSQQRRASLGMESICNLQPGESNSNLPHTPAWSHRLPGPYSLRVDCVNRDIPAGIYPASPHRIASPSVASEFPTISITPSTQPTLNPFHTPSPTPCPFSPSFYSPLTTSMLPNVVPCLQPYQQPISPSLVGQVKSPLLEDQQETMEPMARHSNYPGPDSTSSVVLPNSGPNKQQSVALTDSYDSLFIPDLTVLGIKVQSELSQSSNEVNTSELPDVSVLQIKENSNSNQASGLGSKSSVRVGNTSNCLS